MTRLRVLVVADYYLPGFRAGGPVRAISNTIERLKSSVDFFVVTRDHDADGSMYHDIDDGTWTGSAPVSVHYAPRLSPGLLKRCVAESACDVIWLNSFFSTASLGVIALRWAGRIHTPVLLAPRGEFAPAALAVKPFRKFIAMRALLWSGCLRRIHWLASSEVERQEIARAIGTQSITCVPESVEPVPERDDRWPTKSPGRLRAVFASRIMPTKNLMFLLNVLAGCDGDICLDVFGPLEDKEYWAKCRAEMARLPRHITVEYAGEESHPDLQRRLPTYDVLILPTLGENFGHIIVEAWAAGCPVLVSDRTPWRGLSASGVGRELALEAKAWTEAIAEFVEMGTEEHLAMRRSARSHARRIWQEGVSGDRALLELIDQVRRRATSRSSRSTHATSEPRPEPRADLAPHVIGGNETNR
jgi:glycosyltransferase involved in cell wall biosynthesis